MISASLPAAFAHLSRQRNPAVDAALLEALPSLNAHSRAAALDILVQRRLRRALAELVARFQGYDEELQQLLLTRVAGLSPGLHEAIASASFTRRMNAVHIIVASDAAGFAYLLATALTGPCVQTRSQAAEGLCQMTASLIEQQAGEPHQNDPVVLDKRAEYLCEALAAAIRAWELHAHTNVLAAAAAFVDRTSPAILQRLRRNGSTLGQDLCELLANACEPRLAGFAVWALAVPELRAAAGKAIGCARDEAFLLAVADQSWRLADRAIEHGCRCIRELHWPSQSLVRILERGGRSASGVFRFVTASGVTQKHKAAMLAEMLGYCLPTERREVLEFLVNDESETASELLSIIAGRRGDPAGMIADRELKRRRCTAGSEPAPQAHSPPAARDTTVLQSLERCWNQLGGFTTEKRDYFRRTIRPIGQEVGAWLRHKLLSRDGLSRFRSLQMLASLGFMPAVEVPLHRLAFDPCPLVRSLAVRLLGEKPEAATTRVLRAALNDDDPRVQANAIESLDRLQPSANDLRAIERKLDSPHGRVRANAVVALLRAERRSAGEALFKMLEDPSPGHRLSALWVVEELRLASAGDFVRRMRSQDATQLVQEHARRVCDTLAQRTWQEAQVWPLDGTFRTGVRSS